MEWQIILIMVLAAPLILLPVVFVWYLNIAGIVGIYRRSRERKRAVEGQESRPMPERRSA
jgi:hypothetical protein